MSVVKSTERKHYTRRPLIVLIKKRSIFRSIISGSLHSLYISLNAAESSEALDDQCLVLRDDWIDRDRIRPDQRSQESNTAWIIGITPFYG